ncbi:MAG: endolytic transglycosylase MltG [Gemmatimonadetes bacterium]|nr:endolytic transglycosylase MltG [Gemmatimonadota bacterium]
MRPGRLSMVAAEALLLAACSASSPPAAPVEVVVPAGATLSVVADSLAARGIIKSPALFTLWGRLLGVDREIRAGTYAFRPGTGWTAVLRDLTRGRGIMVSVTIPEGLSLREITARIAAVTELHPESVAVRLSAERLPERFGVPGPSLEGYLYPDTYLFAPGTDLDSIIAVLTRRYREFWTPGRRARADTLGMSELQVTTLASIVENEVRRAEELALISAVYHNRLVRGYPLQADPTVLYAMGEHRPRLLYADIDSVADHPYNTYTHLGLPPGPISSPGERALTAVLYPAKVDYLYFVARGDGSHVFTRTLDEHNRARLQVRREGGARSRGAAADAKP